MDLNTAWLPWSQQGMNRAGLQEHHKNCHQKLLPWKQTPPETSKVRDKICFSLLEARNIFIIFDILYPLWHNLFQKRTEPFLWTHIHWRSVRWAQNQSIGQTSMQQPHLTAGVPNQMSLTWSQIALAADIALDSFLALITAAPRCWTVCN